VSGDTGPDGPPGVQPTQPDDSVFPDRETVARARADALDEATAARLGRALADDPSARAAYARHDAELDALAAALTTHAARPLAAPPEVVRSVQAALREAAAARNEPRGWARLGGSLRRHAGGYALAAALLTGLVILLPRLASPSLTSSGGASGSAGDAVGAASAPGPGTPDAPTPAATPAGAASGALSAGSAGTDPSGSLAPRAAAPPSRAVLGAPPDTGRAAPIPGARASDTTAPVVRLAQLTDAARELAHDPLAAAVACPDRPNEASAYRAIRISGQPAWLAVTPRAGRLLLVEVTREVCGPAQLTRTIRAP